MPRMVVNAQASNRMSDVRIISGSGLKAAQRASVSRLPKAAGLPSPLSRLQVNVAAVEPSPGRSGLLVVVRMVAVNRRFAAFPRSLIGSATLTV